MLSKPKQPVVPSTCCTDMVDQERTTSSLSLHPQLILRVSQRRFLTLKGGVADSRLYSF